jgi:hypothetical protein
MLQAEYVAVMATEECGGGGGRCNRGDRAISVTYVTVDSFGASYRISARYLGERQMSG